MIELKTVPTNYGASGVPITNSIDGIIRDMQKMRRLGAEQQKTALVLWIAYPIRSRDDRRWNSHVQRIRDVGLGVFREEAYRLDEMNSLRSYMIVCNNPQPQEA